ncbi:hypothetical protein [Natronosalvus rutilus]|uniref:Uncharacterized protein n=1 Tax=Natronosalvus rutilus TaxID=2953753 RepID=A0A9E7SXV0_9EURY|nr:hypothetical protein [Natronosalvus rutilus]UTF54433.1 hypothetical protein NGM29_03905 [Natronosalvus rutilus]
MQHQSSHAVLVGDPVICTDAHDRLLVDAIVATAAVSESIAIRLERTHFEDDYVDVISLLEDRFGARSDGDEIVYEVATDREIGDELTALLTIDSWQRVHALRSIRLFHDGRCCLEYVPEHTSFTLDEDANPAVISAIRAALEPHPAGVFSTESFVEWEHGETSYRIAPPSLCIGNTCFGVQMLAGMEPDCDRCVIALSWHEPSADVLGNVLEKTIGLIGEPRPDELRFSSLESFESVRDVLERITGVTGIDGSPR